MNVKIPNQIEQLNIIDIVVVSLGQAIANELIEHSPRRRAHALHVGTHEPQQAKFLNGQRIAQRLLEASRSAARSAPSLGIMDINGYSVVARQFILLARKNNNMTVILRDTFYGVFKLGN
ncbi:hypothetical protein ACJX0J_027160 [Zea mays]